MTSFFHNKKILVTGGAGFIGCRLVDRLIELGAIITIADNLFSGSISNLDYVFKKHKLNLVGNKKKSMKAGGHRFIFCELKNLEEVLKVTKGQDIVFHLASEFGGRGYIDENPAICCENFAINTNVFMAAHQIKVDRVAFASTACVYPTDLQKNYGSAYLMEEDDAFKNNWANADDTYGWSKLMGELTLSAYHKQFGMKSSILRYVTAYGPRENETHAIMALIKRAIKKEDPYVVWGSGNQDRDFTYVDDIVEGTLLACEKITNATPINLGTTKRYKISEVAKMIHKVAGYTPKIMYDKTKPEGVKSRALDIKRAKKLLGWEPQVTLEEGIKKTYDWMKNEEK